MPAPYGDCEKQKSQLYIYIKPSTDWHCSSHSIILVVFLLWKVWQDRVLEYLPVFLSFRIKSSYCIIPFPYSSFLTTTFLKQQRHCRPATLRHACQQQEVKRNDAIHGLRVSQMDTMHKIFVKLLKDLEMSPAFSSSSKGNKNSWGLRGTQESCQGWKWWLPRLWMHGTWIGWHV